MGHQRWESAQQEERTCWIQHRDKINTDVYIQKKTGFWNLLMDRITKDVLLNANMRVLDVGCGPSGAFLSDALQEVQLTCIDPLMDEYMRLVPSLKDRSVIWVHGGIEEYQVDELFDAIFAFNSVDHARDIGVSLERINTLLKPDGVFALSLNCHVFSSIAALFSVANPILDPPHPHQYTQEGYQRLIELAGFRIERVLCVDEETHWINEETKNTTPERLSWRFVVKTFLSPQRLFFKIAKTFGYERYGGEYEKKLYTHRIFICRPESV